jgi:hypothetical protein
MPVSRISETGFTHKINGIRSDNHEEKTLRIGRKKEAPNDGESFEAVSRQGVGVLYKCTQLAPGVNNRRQNASHSDP